MDFQKLGLTIVNIAMVMAMVLLLRERVARKRRQDAKDQERLLDLSDWDKSKIPFWNRESHKQTMVVLGLLGIFIVWLGTRNIQSMVESVIMGLIAGGMVLYMGRLDERKEIGAYKKGILHKTGFLYYSNISGYKKTDSDEYVHADEFWLNIGNTPKVQVHVPKDKSKAFEKLIRKYANISKENVK